MSNNCLNSFKSMSECSHALIFLLSCDFLVYPDCPVPTFLPVCHCFFVSKIKELSDAYCRLENKKKMGGKKRDKRFEDIPHMVTVFRPGLCLFRLHTQLLKPQIPCVQSQEDTKWCKAQKKAKDLETSAWSRLMPSYKWVNWVTSHVRECTA